MTTPLRIPATHARERVDDAARAIAADPSSWRRVVLETRSALGRIAKLPATITSGTVHFIQTTVDGEDARYPIEPPVRLGGGGFSVVEESRDLILGHPIIVRCPLPADDDVENVQMSVVEEAWRTERLRAVPEHLKQLPHHPVIPRFLMNGMIRSPHGEEQPCEVYDKAPGVSLRRFVEIHGLTMRQLLDIAWHASRGLQHLQQHGYVHGDVKPDNFCIDEWQGIGTRRHTFLRLIDFDTIATIPEQRAEILLGSRLTGTLMYMPPESFRQDVPEDPEEERAMIQSKDVYALGMTLGRLLGTTPDCLLGARQSGVIDKKLDGPELDFKLPDTLPAALTKLVWAMTRRDWRERPRMSAVQDILKTIRTSLDEEENERALIEPYSGVWHARDPRRLYLGDRLGPYHFVQRDLPFKNTENPLSLLEDRHGRRLIGVLLTRPTREEADTLYKERTTLLREMNVLRRAHPQLFPGTFRDLVREEHRGPPEVHAVWLIRPYLEQKLTLDEYIKHVERHAPLRRRLTILAEIAESLAVLEEAGFHHKGIHPGTILFVEEDEPEPLSGQRHMRQKRYRQELMGMASVHKISPKKPDATPSDMLALARTMHIPDELAGSDSAALESIVQLPTWRARFEVIARLARFVVADEPHPAANGST